jgi:beta-glucanase (GH16 family)
MNYREKEQLSQSDEDTGISRRAFSVMAGASIMAVLAGCTTTTSPDKKITATPSSTEIPTPTMTPEAIIPPEIQKYPDIRFAPHPTFSENFINYTGELLKADSWNILDGPPPANAEAEYYTSRPENVRVENGNLIIQAQSESYKGAEYTSGRIDTRGKEDFTYGKFEITAKIPRGVGTWPAIWMMPTDEIYKNKPVPSGSNLYYRDGEIDIVEAIGSYPNVVYGISHALRYPTVTPYPGKDYNTITIPDMSEAYHTYGLAWTPDFIEMSVDGKPFYHIDKQPSYDYSQWPYDQPYHLILNLALGGSWAGRQKAQFPPDGIDKSVLPTQMQVSSINYFPMVTG